MSETAPRGSLGRVNSARPAPGAAPKGAWAGARGPITGTLIALAFVWIPFSLLPEESGWNLGVPFKLFYSAIGIAAGLFFALLKVGPGRGGGPPERVVAGISLIYLVTVGSLVGLGLVFPQFEVRAPADEIEGASGAERGKALFQDPAFGCYLCHTVTGAGGLRGPDLARVAEAAASRKEGMSADDYLRESIASSTAFVVAGYPPIMPPNYGERLSKDQIEDLVAYLKSLR